MVDFTGAITAAAAHSQSYETLGHEGNASNASNASNAATAESNYEALDRGGGGTTSTTAVDAGPRVYDRLSRHGRQDSFRGFGGGGGGGKTSTKDEDNRGDDPANHIYDSQPPNDVDEGHLYETQPLGNAAPGTALYKLEDGEGDTCNALRPVMVSSSAPR